MRILVIGLDAATLDLVEPWARAGRLPALSRLMARGFSGRLLSTPNMHSASAWTSILTGLDPGKHGLFVFSDRDFTTGRQEFFTGGDRQAETLGAHLARQGLTSTFLNVPMTYPAEGEEGSFMVSGLDAPDLNEKAFYPPELRKELLGRFARYRFSPAELGDLMRAGKVKEATRAWIDLVGEQTDVAEYLIATKATDFFMVVYTASDWAGHNLWDRPDELLAVYAALDEAIERVSEHSNPETQIYVISDHGMGRHSGASYHLADWLGAHGYMTRTPRGSGRPTGLEVLNRGKSLARAVIPSGVKERIKSRIGGERVKRLQAKEKDSFYASIDWGQTVAYSEPGRHVININLAGRNGDGIVPESEYSETCERIARELRQWVDAKGEPVVERVIRRDEAYSGPFVERASDLYVYWNARADLGPPPAEVRSKGFWWKGDHRREGVLIACGPGMRQASATTELKIYDFVPTVMYATGLAIPNGLDGRILGEIFTDGFRAATPLRFGNGAVGPAGHDSQLSEDEEQMIEEKLRGLGYL
jgi:predicted AlkP superfamily phosphohydrolase/phosphomutase